MSKQNDDFADNRDPATFGTTLGTSDLALERTKPLTGDRDAAPLERAPDPPPAEPPVEPELDSLGRRTVENWALLKNTPLWQNRALAAAKHWPQGLHLTEEAYDDAVQWLASPETSCR